LEKRTLSFQYALSLLTALIASVATDPDFSSSGLFVGSQLCSW